MGDGLKDQWGVSDPAKAGSDKQAQQFQASFQTELTAINGHLQYTSTNAEAPLHDPLASRREVLCSAFQSALAQIDPTNPAKAQGAIDKVLADAKALNEGSSKFRREAEKAFNDWQSRQPKVDAAVQQVEELELWDDPKAVALRGLVDGIRTHVNERRYVQACTILDQLLPKLKPIYNEYLRQKEAKQKQKQAYEDALKTVTPKLGEVSKRQFLNLVPRQEEITKVQQQMVTLAQTGDYEKALPLVKDLTTKVEAYLAAAAKEVEPPILGSAQSDRADVVLKKMSSADQEEVRKLMDGTKSEPEKQYLLKGVAAGHSVKELQDFAKKIQGKDATWMRDNLSLTSSSKGTGVEQQWSKSCNATTVQAVRGQMDPLYALKLHEENPNLDQADNADATKMNPKLAEEQKALLTSDYSGKVAKGTSGVATPRASRGSGRWADDLLNNVSDSTGITYTTKKIGAGTTVADAVKTIDTGVGQGEPVPIVIGNSSTDYKHYVLVTGMENGPPKRYTIHDPWTGNTVVRTEVQLSSGTLNIANCNQISAIEEPSTKEVK